MNLLQETLQEIKDSGHKPSDVIFIGSESSGHSCSWDEFIKLADVEYDSGFGASEVATDLIIVFSDGSKMWRDEYDGSEGWKYSFPFIRPANALPISSLIVTSGQIGWCSLSEINHTPPHANLH